LGNESGSENDSDYTKKEGSEGGSDYTMKSGSESKVIVH
jgi:hypothetical protein